MTANKIIISVVEEKYNKGVSAMMQKKVVSKKRLVRYKEGAEMYSMGMNKFQTLAKDAGELVN